MPFSTSWRHRRGRSGAGPRGGMEPVLLAKWPRRALDDPAAAAASTFQGFEPMRNMISPCRYPLLLHPRRYSLLAFDCMCSGIMFGISQSFRTCSDRTISMTLPVVLTLLHIYGVTNGALGNVWWWDVQTWCFSQLRVFSYDGLQWIVVFVHDRDRV